MWSRPFACHPGLAYLSLKLYPPLSLSPFLSPFLSLFLSLSCCIFVFVSISFHVQVGCCCCCDCQLAGTNSTATVGVPPVQSTVTNKALTPCKKQRPRASTPKEGVAEELLKPLQSGIRVLPDGSCERYSQGKLVSKNGEDLREADKMQKVVPPCLPPSTSIHPSIHPSIHLPIFTPCLYLSITPSACLFVLLYRCLMLPHWRAPARHKGDKGTLLLRMYRKGLQAGCLRRYCEEGVLRRLQRGGVHSSRCADRKEDRGITVESGLVTSFIQDCCTDERIQTMPS